MTLPRVLRVWIASVSALCAVGGSSTYAQVAATNVRNR
jgi:hypothetical protein